MTDGQGDPLGVRIVPANVQDRDALKALAPDLERHACLLLAWLDRAFAGDTPTSFLHGFGITPELVGTPGRQGFQVEPRRWKVEQTFGCLQRYRRLRVDDETSLATSRQHDPARLGVHDRHAPRTRHHELIGISGRILVVHPASGLRFLRPRLTRDHADPRGAGHDPSRARGERGGAGGAGTDGALANTRRRARCGAPRSSCTRWKA